MTYLGHTVRREPGIVDVATLGRDLQPGQNDESEDGDTRQWRGPPDSKRPEGQPADKQRDHECPPHAD